MFESLQLLDGRLLLAIQALHVAWLDPIVAWFTQLGNAGLLFLGLAALMLLHPATRRSGLLALCALALGFLCTNVVLKHLVARPRPWLSLPLIPLVQELDPNSFPSGHTCAAFAAALSWRGRLPWKWAGRTAVALAVCMGLSRLYVGVHYPSDVITGGLIGAACAWAALRTTDWLCAWAAQRKNRKGAQ